MKIKLFFLLLLVTFLFPSINITADTTASVSLQWDPVTDADISHYRVYPRQADEPYDYDYDYEEVDTNLCNLAGFDPSKVYYFVVRAVDIENNTSGDSNEVCWDPSNSGQCERGALSSLDGDADSGGSSGGCFISTMSGNWSQTRYMPWPKRVKRWMIDGIGLPIEHNGNPQSPFNSKLDTKNIVTTIHSQGGGWAINAAANPLMFATITSICEILGDFVSFSDGEKKAMFLSQPRVSPDLFGIDDEASTSYRRVLKHFSNPRFEPGHTH